MSGVEVFYSYAHQDELLRAELEKHLSLLIRQGLIAARYHQDYQAVLWARAEGRESLISSFVTLAHLLKLPEQEKQMIIV